MMSQFSNKNSEKTTWANKRAFFPATWGSSHLPVTLMVSRDMALNNNNVKNSFSLTPIAQFVDQVPSYLLPGGPGDAAGGAGSGLANSQGETSDILTEFVFSSSNLFQPLFGL